MRTLERIVERYAWNIALRTVPVIADPAVPGNSVAKNLTFDAFDGFYDKSKIHARLGRHALSVDDPDTALDAWRTIFGPRFPAMSRLP